MKDKKVSAFLILGGNVGDVRTAFEEVYKHIADKIGKIDTASSLYQTQAWGKTDQADFLNQVVIVKTDLPAAELLASCLKIEQLFNRQRTVKNAPRTIDIDILFYGNEIHNTADLTIPHPHLHERRFVLTPLNEIAPRFVHPGLKKTIHLLFKECEDPLTVKKL